MSSSDSPGGATQRWRIDLAYNGEGLHGFAVQPNQTTVAGRFQEVLVEMLQLSDPPLIVAAGRTDTGVHAHAQVIHLDLPTHRLLENAEAAERLRYGLNRQLRGQIVVHRITPVPDTFHARYSAQWRAYRYLVIEGEGPWSLSSQWAWTVAGPLDHEAMNRAGATAVGEHDFRAFCKRAPDQTPEDPIRRRVLSLAWTSHRDDWGLSLAGAPVWRLDIRAESFCHNMVRTLTSTMVAIGQGEIPETELAARLAEPSRVGLPAPAPAAGLSLIAVGYPEFAGGASGFLR